MDDLEEHLNAQENSKITFTFELVYFNSSSAKILMGLFELLDSVAEKGNELHVIWAYEEDDDNMEEMGEEFCEELKHATYELDARAEL